MTYVVKQVKPDSTTYTTIDASSMQVTAVGLLKFFDTDGTLIRVYNSESWAEVYPEDADRHVTNVSTVGVRK